MTLQYFVELELFEAINLEQKLLTIMFFLFHGTFFLKISAVNYIPIKFLNKVTKFMSEVGYF